MPALVALASTVTLGCGESGTIDAELDAYRRMGGQLARAETSSSQARGRYIAQRLRLQGTSGLLVTGSLVRPDANGCFAAVLLQNGREENSV